MSRRPCNKCHGLGPPAQQIKQYGPQTCCTGCGTPVPKATLAWPKPKTERVRRELPQ